MIGHNRRERDISVAFDKLHSVCFTLYSMLITTFENRLLIKSDKSFMMTRKCSRQWLKWHSAERYQSSKQDERTSLQQLEMSLKSQQDIYGAHGNNP